MVSRPVAFALSVRESSDACGNVEGHEKKARRLASLLRGMKMESGVTGSGEGRRGRALVAPWALASLSIVVSFTFVRVRRDLVREICMQ